MVAVVTGWSHVNVENVDKQLRRVDDATRLNTQNVELYLVTILKFLINLMKFLGMFLVQILKSQHIFLVPATSKFVDTRNNNFTPLYIKSAAIGKYDEVGIGVTFSNR